MSRWSTGSGQGTTPRPGAPKVGGAVGFVQDQPRLPGTPPPASGDRHQQATGRARAQLVTVHLYTIGPLANSLDTTVPLRPY
ncbi:MULTISPECIES: hypothetical protein [unclassified Streptomyces]|uniref:Uncharacterized protein n=1 Tax=Streptomyces venezuelae TaxID=54571 RepID=A0A5P2BJ17_STRVZ|nr:MULTISPECIES: hypothetical protein [unclassified Streptomyces]NEA01759.1 hypothetical protein [Streptomyces sp. SID10116]QES30067.1 hypothetical protein DEJ47_29720 [Streptomyces venezuelae]MYY82190.1 hypothetical protein [Streptomyces sp. SID335]MYZ12641.1 hypothetical protein [Streptomyces sp. SID337]NDZ90753.1 hypothetical protein [Streptomyces sp. SID10115]